MPHTITPVPFEVLDIFEMLVWIRKYDNSDGRKYIFTAEFLHGHHLRGVIDTKGYSNSLVDLMILILQNTRY